MENVPPLRGKYLYITVKNCSSANTFTIEGINISSGKIYKVPKIGTKIPPGGRAGFSFVQGGLHGPEVNITLYGQGGRFSLYAQQNYAFLEAGIVTARYQYIPQFNNFVGGCQVNDKFETFAETTSKQSKDFIKATEGAISNSYGQVEFPLAEESIEKCSP